MNFIRKKPSAPLDDLTELYNETANKTIYNLALEQKNELKKAVQGWKSLHTHVLFKLDLINKAYNGCNYSADEIYLKDGIEELDRKAQRHLDRVSRLYDDLVQRYELRQNLAKPLVNSSTYSVPTLRSRSPQSRAENHSSQHQQQHPSSNTSSSRMLKTLRPEKGNKFNSSHSHNKPSELSKMAANVMYNNTQQQQQQHHHHPHLKQNWSTSKSLNSTSSSSAFNKSHDPDDIFDQSFENMDFDLQSLKRNDAFSQLEASGSQSQLARSKTNTNDQELSSQFEKIDLENELSSPKRSSGGRPLSSSSSKFGFPKATKSTPNLIDINQTTSPFDDAINGSTISLSSTPPNPPPSRPPIPKTTQLPTSIPSTQRSTPVIPTKKPTANNTTNTNASTTSKPIQNSTIRPTIRPKASNSQPNKSTTLKKAIPSKPTATPSTTSSSSITGKKPALRQPNATVAGTTATVSRRTVPTTTSTKPTTSSMTKTTKPVSKQPVSSQAPKKITRPTIQRSATPTGTTTSKSSKNLAKVQQSSTSSRSPSPAREETKDTETISSNEGSEEFANEMELSEKEIKEKMEGQIVSEIRGIDHGAAKQIFNEIVVHGDEVHWEDIAGLETAKNSLKETVVYPFLRPDLFSGLREPARGMLLFGPPGTGKTMLARAVATESKSTFFSISASSLTSKYLGESEKLVRALFMLAKKLSPSIIFVDEIDSLLSSRNEGGEHESSRRIKNEFLIQWSDLTHAAAGKDTGEDLQRVLVLAATNLPWAIDEAARRRFVRRQYIPLPEPETRQAQIIKLLAHQKHTLDEKDQFKLVEMTDGFSGSDITALAKDAAMGPLRALGDKLLSTARDEIRPINLNDFESSLKYIRPSVSKENLGEFEDWASKYGSSGV